MIHFVHCWDCRLPCSPSDRRVWLDGLEIRGKGIEKACEITARHWATARTRAQSNGLISWAEGINGPCCFPAVDGPGHAQGCPNSAERVGVVKVVL